jgi:hypothetical protein
MPVWQDRYRGLGQDQGEATAMQSMLGQQPQLLGQPSMGTMGQTPQIAQQSAMAQQQPQPIRRLPQQPIARPAPPPYQRVQQNANAIQQAQTRRQLGAGAGAAAAAQGVRSPQPAAPINQIQRGTMTRI